MNNITPDAVAKHLSSLFGLSVKLTPAKPTDIKEPAIVATISDESGGICCLMHCDLAGAASMGAALSRIPAGVVQDALKKKVLEEGLLENFHEIANIMTVLTTASAGKRTILAAVSESKDVKAPQAAKLLRTSKRKHYMRVAVSGYPDGFLGFVSE